MEVGRRVGRQWDSPLNVIGFREHPNPAYQNLRVIPRAGQYPIVGAYHQRSFGVGLRRRGSAVCVQVTTGNIYAPPSADLIPVEGRVTVRLSLDSMLRGLGQSEREERPATPRSFPTVAA